MKILVIGLGPEGRFFENLSDRTDTVFFPIPEVSKGTVSLVNEVNEVIISQKPWDIHSNIPLVLSLFFAVHVWTPLRCISVLQWQCSGLNWLWILDYAEYSMQNRKYP